MTAAQAQEQTDRAPKERRPSKLKLAAEDIAMHAFASG